MALKSFMTARSLRDEPDANDAAPFQAPSAPMTRTVAPSTSIDSASEFKGTLRSKETVRIDGSLTGELVCEKTVLIGEGAKVHASIEADTVKVSGEVKGNITARSKLTLDRTARVIGDLTTPGIVIEEGAMLEGRIMIGVSDATGKSKSSTATEESAPAAKRGEGRSERVPARKTPIAAAPPPA